MKNIYQNLLNEMGPGKKICLATLLATRGSVPQVPGASALFSDGKLIAGTLGGGVLEGDATRKSSEVLKGTVPVVYDFDLNNDITSAEGAICGGSATEHDGSCPDQSEQAFNKMLRSLESGKPGILATLINPGKESKLERYWYENGMLSEEGALSEWKDVQMKMSTCLEKNTCLKLEENDPTSLFLEPIHPLPKLIIAGAGHIGRALAQHASLIDFEVTVIDDRAEFANSDNIPEADHIIVGDIGKALVNTPKNHDTYLVIVTRGHNNDSEALQACIDSNVPYIGMIGSKKIRLMRENFIEKAWCTPEQFDNVHAPIGLEIGSKTVHEIVVSITAQLIQVRSQARSSRPGEQVSSIILAAGESSRMGKPKMLLPFGDSSIIETVISNATRANLQNTCIVLGANHDLIAEKIKELPGERVLNHEYTKGMLSSVKCGLRAIPESTTAVMVLLGDQPMIGTEIIDKVCEKYKRSDKGIIVASWEGKRGHPVIFSAGYIQEILKYPDDSMLKNLLLNHPEDIEEVETENPEILRDIDTEEDYKRELKNQ